MQFYILVCKEHGVFEQVADVHLRGFGCSSCSQNKQLTTDIFIKKAKVVHGDLYDYSKTIYVNHNTKLIITCKKHGEWLQNTYNHLSGAGCPRCSGNCKLTVDDFLERSFNIHGDKYDYSKVIYIKTKEKLNIICKIHGEFYQNVFNHLKGYGCPKCSRNISNLETEWLNFLKIKKEYRQKYFKINNNRYFADGYDPETNTIYEFNGDFWHGNPNKYVAEDINSANKKSFGELYKKTVEKEQKIMEAGFNLISIWESDWILFKTLNQQNLIDGASKKRHAKK